MISRRLTDMSSTTPLRVLLWSVKGAGPHYGGPGMQAWTLYRAMDPRRVRCSLAHGNPIQEAGPPFESTHLVRSYALGPFHQWAFIHASRRWMRNHAAEFDVVHGLQAFEPTMAAALVAERLGVPAFVKPAAFRTDLADKGNWRSLLGIHRRRRRRAAMLSGIVAISREIAEEMREYGIPEERIARIPNGVDTARFRPADNGEGALLRTHLGLPEGPIVVFVGAIVARKRPHLLVRAIFEARRRGIPATLALVGPAPDPDYHRQLCDLARSLGVSSMLHWIGMTTRPEDYLRAADLFALPSSSEGLPNALAEAAACGRACICTAVSGARDVLPDDETGIVLDSPPDQLDADLCSSIAELLGDEARQRRLGATARRHVLQRLSIQSIAARHDAMFRRVLAGGTAAEPPHASCATPLGGDLENTL